MPLNDAHVLDEVNALSAKVNLLAADAEGVPSFEYGTRVARSGVSGICDQGLG